VAGLTPPRPLVETDDREGFDCGRDSLNIWFRRHAWRNQLSGDTRMNVICTEGAIVGYVSLCAAQIERAHLPKAAQRNRPDPIPALLLAQLAVDRRHHGRGYAKSLLLFALGTAVRFSVDIGCFAVLTHPLDDNAGAFYAHFGFETLPFDPKRSMVVRIRDLVQNGF
jgi:GNAT superfamily N-acetyltransferase